MARRLNVRKAGWILLAALAAEIPAMASQPPYPPSAVITGIHWDFVGQRRFAPGSDLWPCTWAADDNLYASWGDGGGFGGTNSDGRVSLGFARISGPPEAFTGVNVWGGKNAAYPATFGGKCGALLSVKGVLYAIGGVHPGASGVSTWGGAHENRLLWSRDLGKTWQYTDWTFAREQTTWFPASGFLNYGRDYAGARDGYVYLYGSATWWNSQPGSQPPTHTCLARVPVDHILDRSSYEFFSGLDKQGRPFWTRDAAQCKPVFTDPNGVGGGGEAVFNRGIGRYILTVSHGGVGQLGIFDAPNPWGPWTTVVYYDNWDNLGQGEELGYHLPTKWISADGKTIWCIFSSVNVPGFQGDSFNLVRGSLSLRGKP